MRSLLPRAGLIALLLWPGQGCGRPGGSGDVGRGVLVIAVDALRADHVGCYGYDRPTTPALDALAAEGVRFSQAFATAPDLIPAHASLITGCDPNVALRTHLENEVEASPVERWRVPDKVPRLAVEMLVGGFATAAFVDHDYLSPSFGFAPGFQRYQVTEADPAGAREETGIERTSDLFLQWMRSLDRSKPWFAYVHAHDLERVWTNPDPRWEGYFTARPELDRIPPVGSTDDVFFAIPRSRWRGGARTLGDYEATYDGNVRRLDQALQQLFNNLRLQGRYENTTIVVVGTYGVQFGEAGLFLTSGRYSVADLRVPWIMRLPTLPEERRGGEVPGIASLLDLAPTLLETVHVQRPRGMHGVSQLPAVLDAQAAPARDYAFASCGLQQGGAVFGERYVYEYTKVGPKAMRRSWFGDDLDHDDYGLELYYDRIQTPFPWVSGQWVSPPKEIAKAMQAAGATWDFQMLRTRRILQGGTLLFDPAKDAATVAELQAKGFLGDGF
jgi:arylsulfatase A-like enzyme